MTNPRDAEEARRQAHDAAVKERLTSEQQREREQQIQARLTRQREIEQARRASSPDRKEAEREAHRQAVKEAMQRAKDDPNYNRTTVRTTVKGDTATNTIKEKSSDRPRHQPKRQYAQSGAPVQLEGDQKAILSLRAQAFQQAVKKAQAEGRKVEQSDVDRETRNILAARDGKTSAIDESSRRAFINESYANFGASLRSRQGDSDDVYLTPVSGLKGRSVYEGFFESGTKKTAIFSPAVETFEFGMKTPPNDPLRGFTNTFSNLGKLYFVGLEGGLDPVGAAKREVRPSTRIELERETEGEVFGAVIAGRQDLTLGGLPVGGSVIFTEQTMKNLGKAAQSFGQAPLYFAGSAAASAALWFGPGIASRISKVFTGIEAVRSTPKAPAATFTPKYSKIEFTTKPEQISSRDIIPELENPAIAATFKPFTKKQITTLADIDKRLGLRTTDKGDFTEIKSNTGQVLLVKPRQIQKPIMILSNPLEVISQVIKQSTRTKSRQTTIFKPSEMLKDMQQSQQAQLKDLFQGTTTRQRQRSQSLFNFGSMTGQRQSSAIERQLARMVGFKTTQKQTTRTINKPITSELQSFRFQFKPATATRQIYRLSESTLFAQQFRFNFNSLLKEETQKKQRKRRKLFTPFPLFDLKPTKRGQRGKRGFIGDAVPREGKIRDLISVSLGENAKIARDFRALFDEAF